MLQVQHEAGKGFQARRLMVIGITVMTMAVMVVTAQPAWAPTNPVAYIEAMSHPRHTAVVLDVAGWATHDGARVQMWPWLSPPATNQQWRVNNPAMGAWTTLVGVHSNKCLDESAPRNGATVYIYRCTGAANQQWISESPSYDVIRLRNRQDGRCLDIRGVSPNDGASLQVWDCHGGWNQNFGLIFG